MINTDNTIPPVAPPVIAPPAHARDAEYALLEMIGRSQDSIGLLQQQADQQNVMVQTDQELSIYNAAKRDLSLLAQKVEGDTDPVKQSGDSTAYQVAQTKWQNYESQWQGYVSGATSIGSQDSQNMSKVADLGQSATAIQNATQQLMNGFN